MIMKKKKSIIVIALLLILTAMILSACGSVPLPFPEKKSAADTAGGPYRIYYANREMTELKMTAYTPRADSFDGILEELLDQFRTGDESAGNYSVYPQNLELKSWAMVVTELDLDFGSQYLSIGKVPELLLRAGLVRTMLSIPEVMSVRITVDGQPLLDSSGKTIGPMNENSFIIPDENGGINSYRTATIHLYFPDSSGKILVAEERSDVRYSSNSSFERLVTEQLLKGPEGSGLQPIASQETLVRSIQTANGTCMIDFNTEINTLPANTNVDPETAIYALVNSLCSLQNVDRVRIEIEGNSDVRFRGQVNLDQDFSFEKSLILKETEAGSGIMNLLSGKGSQESTTEKEDSTQGQTEADKVTEEDPGVLSEAGEAQVSSSADDPNTVSAAEISQSSGGAEATQTPASGQEAADSGQGTASDASGSADQSAVSDEGASASGDSARMTADIADTFAGANGSSWLSDSTRSGNPQGETDASSAVGNIVDGNSSESGSSSSENLQMIGVDPSLVNSGSGNP